ncbi:hypothetical protein OIU92_25700 [Escherichia coli]|nr:hypothetical protein [Escherichia coli]
MTLARELSESNGKLLQRPVHEAESLRQQHQSISPAQSAINMFCRKTRKQLRFSCSGR